MTMDRLAADLPRQQVEWITPRRFGWGLLVVLCLGLGLSFSQVHPAIIAGVLVGIMALVLLFFYPYLGVLAYLVFGGGDHCHSHIFRYNRYILELKSGHGLIKLIAYT